MANGYSTIIRPCSGTGTGLGDEPSAFGWDVSTGVSEGVPTITKNFFFTLTSSAISKGIKPYEVCPAEVMKAQGFPVKFSTLPESSDYVYLGNGNIVHEDPDSIYWVYQAEYTSRRGSGGSINSDGHIGDENTPPWKRKPQNVQVSYPEVEIPFRYAYNKNNNRFTTQSDGRKVAIDPVVNTAGDRIDAVTTKRLFQLSFTYSLQPKDFDVDAFTRHNNSINSKQIKVCGLIFPAESCLLLSADPQYHDEYTDGTNRKRWSWWEISIVIQHDYSGDGFEQKLLNIGNRAVFPYASKINNDGTISRLSNNYYHTGAEAIYQWRSFPDTTTKQNGINSTMQIGNISLVSEAQRVFNDRFGGQGATFAYEESQNMPLDKDGQVLYAALDPASPLYQKYYILHFQEHKLRDWASLKMPQKGVDW